MKLLNESRSKIINELNGQVSKSRKFPDLDISYFNEKIGSIETCLNVGIPVVSKLKAAFIRDSGKKQVLYQGFKFSRVPSNPKVYYCTYNVDPNNTMFGCMGSCWGYVNIDEKGFLQPGSFVAHYHCNVKEGYKVRNLGPSQVYPVKLDRLTTEGHKAGKHFKLNQLIDKKLQEAMEYSKEVSPVRNLKYLINK